MTLAFSTCALLSLLMQLVNGAQFLNINFLLVLFASASAAAAVLLTVIFPLTRIYIYHYNHISILAL